VKNQHPHLLFDGVSNGSINVMSAKTKQRTKQQTPKRKLSNDVYEAELFRLQTEFVKLQEWVRYSGARIVVVFEGRDGAGIAHLPAKGEIVLFDRSWYNRAGVERVMGFCTPQEHALFLRQTPIFEQMLIEDGILLRKYWFSVSDDEQLRRFKAMRNDPVRQWKLSTMDLESLYRREDYSRAKDEMMVHTDTPGVY
jgi:polyphosphate kinase 2 (PPK2 family)